MNQLKTQTPIKIQHTKRNLKKKLRQNQLRHGSLYPSYLNSTEINNKYLEILNKLELKIKLIYNTLN